MTTKNLDGKDLTIEEALTQYRNLIKKITNKMFIEGKYRDMDREDVFQLVSMSLVHAYNTYDHGRGKTFLAYAYFIMIRQTLNQMRGYNNGIHIPPRVRETMGKIRRYEMEDCSADVISETFNQSIVDAQRALKYISHFSIRTFSDFEYDDDEESYILEGALSDSDDFTSPVVNDFIKFLDDDQQTIVRMRLSGFKLREIGDVFGITHQATQRRLMVIRKRWYEFKGDIAHV